MNINIGGCKGFKKFSEEIQKLWHTMDAHPNADVVYNLNSGKRIALPDNSVNNYYCSHTLEHVTPKNLPMVLKELHRTLKSKGKLRIVVPDIKDGIRRYLANEKGVGFHPHKPADYPPTSLGYLMAWINTHNTKHGNGHEMAFDIETLKYYLCQAKFNKMKILSYNKCSPIFSGKDFGKYAGWSIYVEVTK